MFEILKIRFETFIQLVRDNFSFFLDTGSGLLAFKSVFRDKSLFFRDTKLIVPENILYFDMQREYLEKIA